ncbi:hypothetical protein [Phenylobacterium sp.]|jgi:hypothetical protein|uniref:hypothetical protein n=1 Tax=Phenylobacterium sp. TaxID=1871053 RepID=UPI002E3233B0|nr:hypothetical protein [Phenylobacterium sp.]HEX3366182.1 hypothetical protein [Phenylobacterium sp.]
MDTRDLVDVAIDEDPRAPCLWVPSELWPEFLAAISRRPNVIGAVIYRNKTVREGGPLTDITTQRP